MRSWIFVLLVVFIFLPCIPLFSQGKVIKVKTAQEFANAIGPNVTIELAPGEYDLTSLDTGRSSKYYYLFDEYDGKEFRIRNVSNLKIIGKGDVQPHLLTQPAYGDVIQFEKCSNVTLDFIDAGHGKDKRGYCTGGVLNFLNCSNVQISNSILYGSGTYGITADSLMTFTCKNTEISGCTYGVMSVYKGKNLRFEGCKIFDNTGFDMISISRVEGVTFDKCSIYKNIAQFSATIQYIFFAFDKCKGVVFNECKIEENTCKLLFCWTIDDKGTCGNLPSDLKLVTLKNCTIERNVAGSLGMGK